MRVHPKSSYGDLDLTGLFACLGGRASLTYGATAGRRYRAVEQLVFLDVVLGSW